jgi:hypothetical protein
MVSSFNVTITGIPSLPVSSIAAVRIQDVENNVTYEWDAGVWSSKGQPKCKNGGALYVAGYFVNNGGAGVMTATITAGGVEIGRASTTVAAGGSLGVEGNTTMPASGNLNIQLVCNP